MKKIFLFLIIVTGLLSGQSVTKSAATLWQRATAGRLTPVTSNDSLANISNISISSSLKFNPYALADLGWSGETIRWTVGETVTAGVLMYLKSDGKFWKTDADAEATTKGLLAIACGSITADQVGTLLLKGWLRYDALFGLTVGAPYFVGLTAGAIETSPSATGDFARVIGYGWTADIIFFCPDNAWVEIQ